MSDPADINARLEAAAEKAENASEILRQVGNGPVGAYAETESGPVPSLLEWQKINEDALGGVPALQEAVNEVVDFKTTLEAAHVYSRLEMWVSITDFGADPTGVNDSTTAFVNARNFIAAAAASKTSGTPPILVWPAGTYKISVSPNWGIQYANYQALGIVRIRCTGNGSAFILDGGAASPNVVHGGRFGGFGTFIIEAAPTAVEPSIFIRSAINFSVEEVRVHGGGPTQAGVAINWGVLGHFKNVKVTAGDEDGWYLGGRPKFGFIATQRGTGEQTSYCKFDNCASGATEFGMYFDYTLGNTIDGGDNEYVPDTGIVFTANARNDRMFGLNNEVNSVADISCSGQYIEFYGVDSNRMVFNNGSKNCLVYGGNTDKFEVYSVDGNHKFDGLKVNRGIGADGYIMNDPTCDDSNVIDLRTGKRRPPPAPALITGIAGTFTITNTHGRVWDVTVAGGTVSGLTLIRNGSENSVGLTSGMFTLNPGDSLKITSTVFPTVIRYTR